MAKSRNAIYAERDAKYYTFKRIKVRNEWNFSENIKEAASTAGESMNGFMIKAIVERARSLGVPFENGPFFNENEEDATTTESDTHDE